MQPSRFVAPVNLALEMSGGDTQQRTQDTIWTVHKTVVNDSTTVVDSTMVITPVNNWGEEIAEATRESTNTTLIVVGVATAVSLIVYLVAGV